MRNGGDLGPVLLNRFVPLFDEAQALQNVAVDHEDAPRLEAILLELANMIMLDLPDPLAKSLSFQVCTAIVAQFVLDMGDMVQKGAPVLPEIQAMIDKLDVMEIPA